MASPFSRPNLHGLITLPPRSAIASGTLAFWMKMTPSGVASDMGILTLGSAADRTQHLKVRCRGPDQAL